MNAYPRALGSPLEGNKLVRLVYVEEAGTSQKEPVLSVAAVIVDADRQLLAVERHIDKLVERWIPEHQREGFVFHATELFNGTHGGSGKPFERGHPDWPMSKRLEIADSLAAIPKRFGLTLTAAWLERTSFPHTNRALLDWNKRPQGEKALLAHVCTFLACAAKVDQWMRQKTNGEVCLLVVEDHEQARSTIRAVQNRYQQASVTALMVDEGKEFFPLKRIKEDPLFQAKRPSSVLQLADFCAYTVKKLVASDSRYLRFYEPLKERFHAFELVFSD